MTDTSMIEDDQPYREFDDGALRVFGYSYDVQAVQQIKTVSGHGWVSGAALMADNHLGYSMPIGGVAAYREMVSPLFTWLRACSLPPDAPRAAAAEEVAAHCGEPQRAATGPLPAWAPE